MTDGGSSDTENDVAHRDLRAETKVLIRSRALLALLRGQLRLLEQALLDHSPQAIGEPPPTAIQRLKNERTLDDLRAATAVARTHTQAGTRSTRTRT